MNNKNVEVIAPASKTMCLKGNKETKLIKACAYCRVSTDNEDRKQVMTHNESIIKI